MNITVGQILVWVIVGALAGSLAGILIKRRARGFGPWGNLLIGLVGALIGGAIFDLLNINVGLGQITITGEDVLAAFLGALLVLAAVHWLRGRRLF